MRVLIVEDNEVVAQAVATGLRDQGFAVDVADNGAVGLDKAALSPYDVIVLDRDLPVVHGDDVCARLAGALQQYRAYLIAEDRQAEAQQIHEQVGKMTRDAGIYCSDCTVSVNSLSKTLR